MKTEHKRLLSGRGRMTDFDQRMDAGGLFFGAVTLTAAAVVYSLIVLVLAL